MLFFTSLIALYALISGAWARNGCRQCQGQQTITFDQRVNQAMATAFFGASIAPCATGQQYDILWVENGNCHTDCVMPQGNKCLKYGLAYCTTWTFKLRVWRYCGNGQFARLHKKPYCYHGFCATVDNLELNCYQSVDCKETCHCEQCGCV